MGAESQSQARTSWSAPLPGSDPVVECVLNRAQAFLGTVLNRGATRWALQMVRYTQGQKFDVHHDWFVRPRLLDADAESGRRRLYNRVATLFAVLECSNCTDGETWFPKITPLAAVHDGENAHHGSSEGSRQRRAGGHGRGECKSRRRPEGMAHT